MVLFKNGFPLTADKITPMFVGMDITIGIDSSKSNTGIVVGDSANNMICDFEVNGAGESTNVYDLCWDTRKALKVIFGGANVIAVGIEDIITKVEDTNIDKNGKRKMSHLDIHNSRAKITAVFNTYIAFFQDNFEMTPELIPNQSWKAAMLPEEFRKRTHDKGSKDFLLYIGDKLGGRSNDVTDAYFIWKYLCMLKGVSNVERLTCPKPYSGEFTVLMYEPDVRLNPDVRVFIFDKEEFTYNNLMSTVKANLKKGEVGFVKIPINMVTPKELYAIRTVRPLREGLDYIGLLVGADG